MSETGVTKLWANSGDSHYMEPPDLYERLPEHLRNRMPRTVPDEARGVEVITVDGQSFERGYRQHGAAVRPKLSKLPSQFLFEQVYASFQHDRSAIQANMAMGWKNVMWGSDYPHYEGTYGHTQKTLHELFDGCPPEDSYRMRMGAFQELFPHVPAPPAV